MQTATEDKVKYSQKVLELHCVSGLKHFKKVIRSHVVFHLVFACILLFEIAGLITTCVLYRQSAFFALCISVLVLSIFTYLVLLFYMQSRKPEQFRLLKQWFLSVCSKSLSEDISPSDYHLFLAQALFLFSQFFQTKEIPTYLRSFPLDSIQRVMKKLSWLWHYKNFQRMKEILLLECTYEHLSLLKIEPMNLEVHASLGNSYLALSSVYKGLLQSPVKSDTESSSFEQMGETLEESFQTSIQNAIEEYKIIYETVKNDPWVLAQLATCYHELEMYDKEIEHFEKILEVSESQNDVMLRLAYLYFQEGHNAQGFKIYKLLKESHHEKADELFSYYISKGKQEAFL